jgi:hypothetical protein
MTSCKNIGCKQPAHPDEDFCWPCISKQYEAIKTTSEVPMSTKYPKYYKSVDGFTEIDVYAIHHLFDIQDPSGAIQHASKKLLLSGVRTGGKTMYQDIKEARDTLTRWLQLQEPKK